MSFQFLLLFVLTDTFFPISHHILLCIVVPQKHIMMNIFPEQFLRIHFGATPPKAQTDTHTRSKHNNSMVVVRPTKKETQLWRNKIHCTIPALVLLSSG